MKKGRRIAMVLIWLVLAIGFGIWSWMAREDALQPVTVYRIAQEIPLNSKIGMTDFQEVQIPGDAVTQNMVRNPEEIVNAGLHASTRLIPGQYAVEEMFVTVENVDPFEIIDLTDLRQVTIPADYVDTMGGNIASGDSVDLVYIGYGQNDDTQSEYTYARTFAQEVLVYSVTTDGGYRFEKHADRLEGQVVARSDEDLESQEMVSHGDIAHVTLAVDTKLAEEINARMATGEVKIVGRFDVSENADSTGYVIGEFTRQFTGQGNPETNE